MPSLYDIKNRIKSVNSTVELTRAMYLISTSRIRKALSLFESNHLYFVHVRQAIKHILSHIPHYTSRFLKIDNTSVVNTAYIVIASNKGMAGGYNHNVCTEALEHMKKCPYPIKLFTVGYMATEFFRRRGYNIEYRFEDVIEMPSISAARRMMESIYERMNNDKIDEVYVAYTQMHSSSSQKVHIQRLLPLLLSDFADIEYEKDFPDTDIIYEPDAKTVINALVPQYLLGMLYGMLVSSYASEQSMRMAAMHEATENAEGMIDDLKLKYNSARQAAITQEITEIVSGANAMDQ